MTPVMVAGLWLAASLTISLLVSVTGRRLRGTRPTVAPPRAPQPRTFVSVPAVDWLREADRVAVDELLGAGSGQTPRIRSYSPVRAEGCPFGTLCERVLGAGDALL